MFAMLEDGPFVDQFVTLPDEQPPPDTITVSSIPTADKGTPDAQLASFRYRFVGFRGVPNSWAFYAHLRETVDPNEPALKAEDGPPNG
jgi:hypothetical protein